MTTAFKTVKCRACGAYIIFMPTLKNKNMPVNADTVQEGDLIFDRGKHHSHFDTCPKADQFRKQVKRVEAKANEKPEPTGVQSGFDWDKATDEYNEAEGQNFAKFNPVVSEKETL